MKRMYFILGCLVLLIAACQKFDDIALWNMANNQEQRLAALEELCSRMNTNIDAVQTIVSASQNGDYITNVSPVMKDGVEIGYTITFAQNGTITIYHGTNGTNGGNEEGTVPLVGLKQDADGFYYWTLNGEWLLDDRGSKVRASGFYGADGENGENGQDGKTPKLKIENGRWMLSMDGGNTWEDAGQATGDKGEVVFEEVDCKTDSDYVIFTLIDGTVFKLPKYANGDGGSNGRLSITFSETTDILVEPLVDYDITYSIIGADENTTIEAIGIDGFKATVTPSSVSTGIITVTPAWKNENKSVVIIVRDGEYISILKRLTFKYDDEYMYIIMPDPCRIKLLSKCDFDNNAEISYAEARTVSSIEWTYISSSVGNENLLNFYSMDFLQFFTNLESLELNSFYIEGFKLDIPPLPALTELNLSRNKFTSLDVSKCTNLRKLFCRDGDLTSLDVSKNTALISLDCLNNQLTSLDVSNTVLRFLHLSGNKLSTEALNKIFTDLPQGETWNVGTITYMSTVYIFDNPGTTTCDKSIAEKKGWRVTI